MCHQQVDMTYRKSMLCPQNVGMRNKQVNVLERCDRLERSDAEECRRCAMRTKKDEKCPIIINCIHLAQRSLYLYFRADEIPDPLHAHLTDVQYETDCDWLASSK